MGRKHHDELESCPGRSLSQETRMFQLKNGDFQETVGEVCNFTLIARPSCMSAIVEAACLV